MNEKATRLLSPQLSLWRSTFIPAESLVKRANKINRIQRSSTLESVKREAHFAEFSVSWENNSWNRCAWMRGVGTSHEVAALHSVPPVTRRPRPLAPILARVNGDVRHRWRFSSAANSAQSTRTTRTRLEFAFKVHLSGSHCYRVQVDVTSRVGDKTLDYPCLNET